MWHHDMYLVFHFVWYMYSPSCTFPCATVQACSRKKLLRAKQKCLHFPTQKMQNTPPPPHTSPLFRGCSLHFPPFIVLHTLYNVGSMLYKQKRGGAKPLPLYLSHPSIPGFDACICTVSMRAKFANQFNSFTCYCTCTCRLKCRTNSLCRNLNRLKKW